MEFEEYNEKQLLETAKKYDRSYWDALVKSLRDFICMCNFTVQEESYESYLSSGGSSRTYYSYNKNKLLYLVFIELKKEVEKKDLPMKEEQNETLLYRKKV